MIENDNAIFLKLKHPENIKKDLIISINTNGGGYPFISSASTSNGVCRYAYYVKRNSDINWIKESFEDAESIVNKGD